MRTPPTIHRLARSWLPQVAAVTLVLISGACRNSDTKTSNPVPVASAATVAAPSNVLAVDHSAGPVAAPAIDAQEHDPAHPSIDCPLHKLSVDPTHLRPFDEVEKYIAFLEKPERAIWQKPDEVIGSLGLKGTETLVDVGAGSGYFAFRFARALHQGKVIAVDTEAEMIRHIHHKVVSEGIKNVQAVLTKPDDPEISQAADWVFICDVLHHVPDRAAWLGRIAKKMKPGARLALIEFKEGKLPEGPPEGAKIPRAQLISLADKAGLTFEGEKQKLLPYQVLLVFRKP
jgi:2-polyprenyl-3-methyl-5-hydroxy-6-metoxy-1,4-benzoquinol methylase